MTRFTFDPDRSRIEIHASSTIHPIHTSAAVTGWIEAELTPELDTVDATRPVAAEVAFDLSGMRSGNPLIDREAERRLHIRRHPTVTGTLERIVATAERTVFDATGPLTFHGVTRPLAGTLRIEVRDGVVGLTGTTRLDVTDFDVQPPSLVLVKVHKDVRVELAAFAEP